MCYPSSRKLCFSPGGILASTELWTSLQNDFQSAIAELNRKYNLYPDDLHYAFELLSSLPFPVSGNALLDGMKEIIHEPDRDYIRLWAYHERAENPDAVKDIIFFSLDAEKKINGAVPHFLPLDSSRIASIFIQVPDPAAVGNFHVYVALEFLNFDACEFKNSSSKEVVKLLPSVSLGRPGLSSYLVDCTRMGMNPSCPSAYADGHVNDGLLLMAFPVSELTNKEIADLLKEEISTLNQKISAFGDRSDLDPLLMGLFYRLVLREYFHLLAIDYDFADLTFPEQFMENKDAWVKQLKANQKSTKNVRTFVSTDEQKGAFSAMDSSYMAKAREFGFALHQNFLKYRKAVRKNTAAKRVKIETSMEEKLRNEKAQVDEEINNNKGKGKPSPLTSVND